MNNNNDLSKDVSNTKSSEIISSAKIENAALTITSDINKWYSDKSFQKLESRLETNIEQENTEGITTAVDEFEGVQTSTDEKDKNTIETAQSENGINTSVESSNVVGKTAITDGDNKDGTFANNSSSYSIKRSSIKQNTSKIRTRVDSQLSDTDTNEFLQKSKIQTRINRKKNVSKVISNSIKTKKTINRAAMTVARQGRQIQTASEGNIGESFTYNLNSKAKSTIGKVADLSTRKSRQKIRGKIAKTTVKVTKAVLKKLLNLLKALMQLLIKALPVIIVIVIFLVFIMGIILSNGSSVFGEYAKDSTLSNYVEYMDNVEGELSSEVNWKAVCAVIYGLNIDIQYDEAEQYLLEQFKKANLYVESSEVSDYIEWLNNNYSVVITFYNKKGITDNEVALSDSTTSLIQEYYNTADFMKLIDEKRGSSVNTGSVPGSTGSGALEGKLSYPTSSRTISAGYPNYSSGKYHGGIDFAVATGTDVCAAADGTVIVAKELNYSYGHYIIVDHGNGVSTLYAHNSKLLVGVGDTVTKGQTIAKSGSTGNSTGPHCHFEVRINGTRVNPLDYLE